LRFGIQIKPGAADEAGHFAILGGMTDQAGGFIDREQAGIFEDNIEHMAFLMIFALFGRIDSWNSIHHFRVAMRQKILICLVLAAVTVAIYWPAGHFGIVYFDDPVFVTDNPNFNDGLTWHDLWWSFTGVVVSNWHPVTSLSFVLTHQFFGQCPPAEHWVNILFHAINAALLFLVLQRLTSTVWRAGIVAAIFAWHPLRVESVAWIAERKDVLCGFFILLAILTYVAEAVRNAPGRDRSQLASLFSPMVRFRWPVLFYLLALMSKPMAVSLPLLLLTLDVWPLKRLNLEMPAGIQGGVKSIVFEKWPFVVPAMAVSILTFWLQKNSGAMILWSHFSYWQVIATVISGYTGYLAKFFYPAGLSAIYVFHNITNALEIWLRLLLLLSITVLCLLQMRRRPYLFMGWFWYLISCTPIIGLVQVGIQSMADRYTYLPLIGPAVSVVWLTAEWAAKFSVQKVLAVATCIMLAGLAVISRRQVAIWHDTVALFEHAVEATPSDNYAAYYTLGTGLEWERGMTNAAMTQFYIAATINPADRRPYLAMADVFKRRGQFIDAVIVYSNFLRKNPDDVPARLELGELLMRMKMMAEARAELEMALKNNPDNAAVLRDLAWILATSPNPGLRNGSRAVELAQHACALTKYQKSQFVGTLAAAYAEAGRFDDAMATAQQAILLAQQNNETDLLEKSRELFNIFQAHQPYREVALVPAAK
jgi:hypothetical protein